MLKKSLDIGEVVKRAGLPASTLRYYEEKGLIKSVGRHGLRRMFDVSVLHRLSLISLGRLAGMSLEEINTMFSRDGIAKINRQQLSNKADELEQKIMHLSTMRDGLRHAASCPEPNHFECPKFNQMLRLANRQIRVLNKKS
ncbi:helix-turn-helix domain-containing protein [Teredinibacter haidensis]|uniref:helix-turn-helix domain-containing protein n=1 Tax=Teredinibacter haidensis TaxID=2731755 RepID=UPI000948BDC1|nr:helix-turn-helix domain-containing protein [Teredinibacter haidensis]